jgi:hypothetical protein
VRGAAVLVVVLAAGAPAAAQDGGPGARAIARAGAALFGDDAAALLVNPAAVARRGEWRAIVGAAIAVDARAVDPGALAGAPRAVSRAGAGLLPWGGLVGGVADGIVVGAVVAARMRIDLAYPVPGAFVTDDRAFYPQRYAGTRLALARTDAALGIAVSPTPWLALGASVGASRTTLEHGVTVWGGDAAVADLGALDPRLDMAFVVSGSSAPAPAATVSAIVAPPDIPVELMLAATFAGAADVDGTPALSPSRAAGLVGATVAPDAVARLALPGGTTVRAGARAFFGPAAVEVDAELRVARGSPAWAVTGVDLVPAGGSPTALAGVPLGADIGTTGSVRGSAEVSLGLLTLCVGAGVAGGGGATPVWPGGPSFGLGAGAEARAGRAVISVGVGHTFRAEAATDLLVVAPRAPAPSIRAAPGPASGGTTVVGLDVAVDLP